MDIGRIAVRWHDLLHLGDIEVHDWLLVAWWLAAVAVLIVALMTLVR